MPGAVAILLAEISAYSLAMFVRAIIALFLMSGCAAAQEAPLSAAQQREVQLDSLFGELRGSQGADAQALTARIWEVWAKPVSATAEVLLAESNSAMAAKEYDVARSVLDKLIAAYPDLSEGYNRRATLLFVTGKYDESLKDIEKVLDLEPRHFGALAGRGMIYQKQQKWSQALAAFEQALKINPGLADVKAAIRIIGKLERSI